MLLVLPYNLDDLDVLILYLRVPPGSERSYLLLQFQVITIPSN